VGKEWEGLSRPPTFFVADLAPAGWHLLRSPLRNAGFVGDGWDEIRGGIFPGSDAL